MIRIGTLCSGIEAPIMALESMGMPFVHVFSCELDKHCRTIIEKKYSPEVSYNDVVTIASEAENLSVDVLVAGLPCQSFSQIGKQGGINDDRGKLFRSFCEVLDVSRPEWFVVENVKNLTSRSKEFDEIREAFEAQGYQIEHKMMDSSKYGTPQARKRVYIVGRRGAPTNYEWPQESPLRYTLDQVMGGKCEREFSYTLRVGGRGSGYGDRHNWDQYKVDDEIVTLSVEQACLLQGFPMGFYNGIELPMSAKMGQMGNSMTVDVIGSVMGNLHFMGKKWIDWR
jgi:DNA (cytosine-5)-methyltransferase 1